MDALNFVILATADDDIALASLKTLVAARRPRYVAILGVTAYRTAFARPKASIGPQPGLLATGRLWILPNPSGLNASWQPPRIAAEFRELRKAFGDFR